MEYYNCKSKKGKDDYETPEHIWELFFSYYTNKSSIVWDPFYCNGLSAQYINKHHSNNFIHENRDFFNWQPDNWNCIISNPPYSCKQKVFERCVELDKPFALFVPLDTLERTYIRNALKSSDLQLLFPKKRTHFITNYDVKNTCPPHFTLWICWKMKLCDGRQIIFA